MDHYVHLLILTTVVVLALAVIFIGNLFFKDSTEFKLQRIYLLFIIFHSIYVSYFTGGDYMFINVGAPFSLFYAPLFYSNILAIIQGEKFKIQKVWVHFILGFAFVLTFVLLYIQKNHWRPYVTFYLHCLYIVTCVQLIFYAILVYLKFNKVAKDSKMIAFMNQSILVMIVSVLVFSGMVFRDKTQNLNFINSFLLYVIMLLIVIIIFRYNLAILVKKLKFYKGKSKMEYFSKNLKKQGKLGKYYKSKLNGDEMEDEIKALEKLLNNQIYLQPNLTLDVLAKRLNMSAHRLSQIFTTGMQSNFNKVINSYRIQYAVDLLTDRNGNDTIEEIGLKSGFNSRASFYRAFKLTMDMTPSDYRKKNDIDQ
ncbi:helix-turn-helix domain-containing protein [Flavobacterium sp. JP2137]|uniref:helix-turn-helix domain-containing protein n=1 Tax=Flavobacterium sp. JP2137 TaxID=3414510 RepID=UPI003D2FDBE8